MTRTWPGLTILALHGTGALGAWWLLPHGFPVAHPRFWAHEVLPLLAALVATAGMGARWKGIDWLWRLSLAAFPAAWIAGAIGFRVLYPVSAQLLWLFPLAFGLWLGWTVSRIGASPRRWREWLLPVGLGAGVALSVTFALHGPAPSTVPVDGPAPRRLPAGIALDSWPVAVGPAQIVPGDGAVQLTYGKRGVRIEPLLTFVSRSPDRFMTLVARPADRRGPQRNLVAATADDAAAHFLYQSDFDQSLTVERISDDDVSLDARARLEQPIYSHLNSFCELHLQGFSQPALVFSPCEQTPIEITVSDYPIGRPRRIALLAPSASGGRFRVVEASSGEKGPFRELVSGPLERGDPVTITVCDGEDRVCRITLEDWSRQVSTALSPTAGWGLPMNAIEFSRDEDDGTASVWVTLAGTSVGRGFDSVGHAAGNYRNRLRVESADSR